MRRVRVFIWSLSVLLTASLFFAVEYFFLKHKENDTEPPLQQLTQEAARVKFVYDGDTILIDGNQKVRLLGIDAPEKGEKCYQEAKEYLLNLVLGKEVVLKREENDKDKYGLGARLLWLSSRQY